MKHKDTASKIPEPDEFIPMVWRNLVLDFTGAQNNTRDVMVNQQITQFVNENANNFMNIGLFWFFISFIENNDLYDLISKCIENYYGYLDIPYDDILYEIQKSEYYEDLLRTRSLS